MEIVYEADGQINFAGDQDERPHHPDGDELWQESFVLYLFDSERGVYAFLRIAQTPNYKGGTAQIMLNIWTPECFYKHTDDEFHFDGSGLQENSLTMGDNLVSYAYDGNFRWTINDPDYEVTAELVFEGYHGGLNYLPGKAEFVKKTLANHTQATGWVSGRISIQGKVYDVAGHGWRDHSWGHRSWKSIRAHRFFPTIFDKDFYFINATFVGEDGKFIRCGLLVRNGKMIYVEDLSLQVLIGEDGVSNCGGRATLNADGERFVFEYEPVAKSSVIMVHGIAMTEGMCRVKCGDRTGVACTESTSHAHGGEEDPFVYPESPGIKENGIHPIRVKLS